MFLLSTLAPRSCHSRGQLGSVAWKVAGEKKRNKHTGRVLAMWVSKHTPRFSLRVQVY